MVDLSGLNTGLEGHTTCSVATNRMAPAMGSGGAPVFATPSMIALMEGAAVDCVEKLLPEGHQSLGIHIDVQHIAATPADFTITATARLVSVEGRKLSFAVEAHDGVETIGKGTHTRVVVDTPRFMARLATKLHAIR